MVLLQFQQQLFIFQLSVQFVVFFIVFVVCWSVTIVVRQIAVNSGEKERN